MTPAEARGALATAETSHGAARTGKSSAAAALGAAETAYQDGASTANARRVREAREADELAGLTLAGAARRLGVAQQELDAAELAQAQTDLEAAQIAASRVHFLDAIQADIEAAAELDAAALPVDILEGSEAELRAAFEAKVEHDFTRALVSRRLHAALAAQHEAVKVAVAAATRLGWVTSPRLPAPAEEISERQILAAIELEAWGLQHPTATPEEVEEFLTGWQTHYVPDGTMFAELEARASNVSSVVRMLGGDVGPALTWAREVIRAGTPFKNPPPSAERWPGPRPARPALPAVAALPQPPAAPRVRPRGSITEATRPRPTARL